jgi:hypothetical protein
MNSIRTLEGKQKYASSNNQEIPWLLENPKGDN